MNIKYKIALLTLFTTVQFTAVNAAPIDDEMAILAAEQEVQDGVEVFLPEEVKEKSKKELREEEKKIEEEREEARKKLKEERDKTRDEVNKKKLAEPTSQVVQKPAEENPAPVTVIETPPEQTTPANMANPIVEYSTFEEVVNTVKFTPLYIPKKSGYTINSMSAINGNMAEIRYGRRWEPEVSLHVRTYRRPAGEELRDISGINGVKWRVDKTTGTSIYIAKISETSHVAAWASGNFTFSAYVENLSFASFHSIVADELVDLSNHYYVGI